MSNTNSESTKSSGTREALSALLGVLVGSAIGFFAEASTTRLIAGGVVVIAASVLVFVLGKHVCIPRGWRRALMIGGVMLGVFYVAVGLYERNADSDTDTRSRSQTDVQSTQAIELTQLPTTDKRLIFDGDTIPYPADNFGEVDPSYGEPCQIEYINDHLVFEVRDISSYQECSLRILPHRKIVSDAAAPGLGFLEADFAFEGVYADGGVPPTPIPDKLRGTALYLDMSTFTGDIDLAIACGIGTGDENLQAYFHIRAYGPAEQLVCAPSWLDQDPSDWACDIHYIKSEPLSESEVYRVRLEADGESPGVFRCTVKDPDGSLVFAPSDFYVRTDHNEFIFSDLADVLFQRWIKVTAVDNSPAIFSVDNVYESR